ncbi:MAG: DUF971 domain-containing protein [Caldithrix sp.]|nr:MAG: DUF971 domain-containing protein [Caldithrix sp.]TDI99398.1 MAG: DUF971 domain-containing protein [Caldithrix sp.]
MDKKFFAKEISVGTEEQTMTIVWADEHRSVFPLEGLRFACPCVECAGGHDQMGKPFNPALFKVPATQIWKISDLQEVGNYALQIFWEDGHNTGIYGWETLRGLCPCELCQTE